jgi:LacI family repressor for deo operon, udp, cdd, tsx, nupC, and nupG
VPAEVSVVGFDNLDLAAYVDPPLTTVNQQKVAMARWAVDRLVRRIEDGRSGAPEESTPEATLLSVELIVRESTAAPPRG